MTEDQASQVPENFSLEKFALVYIAKAFELGKARLPITYFDKHLQERVADAMQIPIDLVRALHHSFHWTFFNEESIFDYQPQYEGMPRITPEAKKILEQTELWAEDFLNPRVILKREYKSRDITDLTIRVWHKYGEFLRNKLESYVRTCGQAAQ